MKYKRGMTREVFLIGRYAFKIPSFRSYRLFLRGILGNIQEKEFSTMKDDRMCPVIFSTPLKFLIVMPRCTESNLSKKEAVKLSKSKEWFSVPVEGKPCSFGYYKGKLVAIDYGS